MTQILRDGEPLDVTWDYTTLSCMLTAAFQEALPDEVWSGDGRTWGDVPDGQFVDFSWAPIYYMEPAPPVLRLGRQILTTDHRFKTGEKEWLDLKKGDVLFAHREHN